MQSLVIIALKTLNFFLTLNQSNPFIMESKIKSVLPAMVQSVADFFEINVEIRLFGVRVFQFTWPPKNEQKKIE